MKDRGSTIFWMAMLTFLVTAFALIIYGGNAYVTKSIARSKLENSLSSAMILAHPTRTSLDQTLARTYLNVYLKKNLKLIDGSDQDHLNPDAGSVATGTVYVEYFSFIPIGGTAKNLDIVTKPSIEAIIQVPVQGGYTIRVYSRTSLNAS